MQPAAWDQVYADKIFSLSFLGYREAAASFTAWKMESGEAGLQ